MSSLSKLLRAAVMLALVFGPRLAEAQKALVYCPVSIDATGCATIKTALTSAYPGGIDAGYDGTQGTVDLKTVDLFQYSVVVVPSLADDSTSPYGLLRDTSVASKLKAALLGRRAFWSGTPDQGVTSTTRPLKDALIQNLAAWAGGDFATVNAPGLVVLQDNSTNVTKRYDWVQAIAGFALVADSRLSSYSAVSSLTAAGNAVLSSNGSTLAYANMASMGFQTPSGAAGTSMDVVGKTGTGVGGQVVLITQTGANTGGAVVTTDKDDYSPGTPVVITGTGFSAGETVTLLLHEDPTIEQDFSFTATADQNGGFVFSGFTPDTLDVDVRFVLTATGQTSGRRAQTTFTDGVQNAGALTFFTVTGGTTCTTTSVTTSVAGTPLCASVTINTSPGNTAGNTAQILWFRQGQSTAAFTTSIGTIPANAAFVATSIQTPDVAGTWTVKLCLQATACAGNPSNTLSSNTIAITSSSVSTTLTLSAPSPASVSFGSSGPVSISATLTATTGGAQVSGASVAFTVDGGSIGSATTNASGVAAISYSPSTLGVGSHTINASFAQATLGGTTYLQSTSSNQSLSVGQASQTISFSPLIPRTYGVAPFTVSASASSGLTVTFGVGATDNCTISGSTVTITGAGSCTVTASQAGNANFAAAAPVPQSFTIAQATATLTIVPATLSATYDGSPHAAIVTTMPPSLTVVAVTYNGATTAPTNAGSYPVVAKLTNANYTATDATGTLNIARATPMISNVSIPAITYPASSASISGTVRAGSLSATGSVGITVSGSGGAILGSAAVDASGNFSTTVNTTGLAANATGYAVALVLPQSMNFEQASDNTHTLVVDQATQSITFGPLGGKAFGDAPFSVSATSTSGLAVTFTASGNCTVAGSTVTITSAGSCTVTAAQAGDGNYQPAPSVPQTFTIERATGSISISGPSTITYGQSGSLGTTKVGDGGVTYAATGGGGSVCNVNSSTGDVSMISGTGVCKVTATLAQGQNYTGATSNEISIDAAKAKATISVNSYNAPYDGSPHGATGTATGLNSVNLGALLHLGAQYTDVPGGTANWAFDGDNNYDNDAGSVQIVITKANQATLVVLTAPANMTYGQAAATLTATGGNGTGAYAFSIGSSAGCSLAGDKLSVVNASATCDVTALRLGDNNYFDSPSTAASVVQLIKADANVSVAGYSGTYDGVAHGATGTATGVLGEDLAVQLALGNSFTDVPGGSASWTFTGGNNYNSTSGNAAIVITPAPTTTLVTVSGATYDANPHGGTAKATGVAGLNQSLAVTYTGVNGTTYGPSTTAPTGAGDYTGSASYAATTNYQASSDTKSYSIAKRAISVQPVVTNAAQLIWTGSPLTPMYDLSVTAGSLAPTEQKSVLGSPTFAPTTVTAVNTYTSTVTGLANPNYSITPVSGTVVVLDQTAPTGNIVSLNPVGLGVKPTLVVNFSDVATGNSKIIAWKYSLDGVDQPGLGGNGTPAGTFTQQLSAYSTTDVVSVCASAEDAGSNWSAPVCALLAIYDPSAGFVTGGGWINSPIGAYTAIPSLTGKANFGFVSKYQKGANVPTGNTEFQFNEANLNFSSTNFQWLVIQGSTSAQFKGTGTINGKGNYNFMVSVVDGDAYSGTKKPDSFRMKITDPATAAVVYDNQQGVPDTDITPTQATYLGGGSIVIHDK